jgi:uncharacterized protein (TIGR01777 family)
MHVFVTGGTGQVGGHLVRRLRQRNDQVTVLSRRPDLARQRFPDCTIIGGDPIQAGPWMDAARACDAVVHLAGENIFARRWNADFKAVLHGSRVKGTENVVRALGAPASGGGSRAASAAGSARRCQVLVNASAIGYYGPRTDEELTEDSPPGDDFLARLCVDWEQAARPVQESGIRLVLLRVGVVLDKDAGALNKMLGPFRWFVGGPVGSGRQYVSWIHHADLSGLILLALDREDARGPLNGTAPKPVTNKEFSKAVGRALHRPSFLRVPRLMLRLRFGGVAHVIATGQRVLPRQALALGYQFQFPDIDGALQNVLA